MKLTTFTNISQRTIAITTGISIVIMAVMAGIVFGAIFNPIFSVETNSLHQSIIASGSAFRYGILGWGVILICDVIAASGLHAIYKKKDEFISQLTAWFRLAYVAVLAVAIVCLILMLQVSHNPANLEPAVLNGLLELFKSGFENTFSFGLIIFGFHLLGLSYLVLDRKPLFMVMSGLLLVSAIGYLLTNTLNFALPNYREDYKSTFEAIFMLPMILSEVGLAIWLIARGGKNKEAITFQIKHAS